MTNYQTSNGTQSHSKVARRSPFKTLAVVTKWGEGDIRLMPGGRIVLEPNTLCEQPEFPAIPANTLYI
jgi:hypothetical protein